jgi:hypothetical protein
MKAGFDAFCQDFFGEFMILSASFNRELENSQGKELNPELILAQAPSQVSSLKSMLLKQLLISTGKELTQKSQVWLALVLTPFHIH